MGDALGVVLSRKAYVSLEGTGETIDPGSAAFQRIVGGLLFAGICLLIAKWRSVRNHLTFVRDAATVPLATKWRKALPWVIANSLAGQTLGVSCYQWALQSTPAGIVLPITATAPLVAMPMTYFFEKEKISLHSVIGGIIAVIGVFGLVRARLGP